MTASDLTAARMGVLAALHEGDAGLAYSLMAGLLADGVPFGVLLDQLLAPIQAESGRRWQVGDYTISEEHASTAAAETLVATLAGAFDQPEDGTHVVVACAEGEVHSLPARMAAALLLSEGFRVTFLGTSVPAADLAEFLRDERPDALVLSCTLATNIIGARASVMAAHDAGVPVLAGGLAFGRDDSRARRIGADAWAPSLRAVVTTLADWSPDQVSSEAAAQRSAAPIDALEDDAPELATSALAEVERRTAELGDRSRRNTIKADLRGLVDALIAATWLSEPGLLADHTRWLADLLDTRGIEAADPILLLDALDSALGDAHREAGDVVAGARATLSR